MIKSVTIPSRPCPKVLRQSQWYSTILLRSVFGCCIPRYEHTWACHKSQMALRGRDSRALIVTPEDYVLSKIAPMNGMKVKRPHKDSFLCVEKLKPMAIVV